MEFEFLVDNKIYKIAFDKKEDRYIFSDGEGTYEADIHFISPHVISILIGEKSHQVYFARDKQDRYFYVAGSQFLVREPGEEGSFQRGEDSANQDMLLVKAPMPGKVIKISVSENEEIRKNQTLAIVEAMKMENEIKSSIQGFVKKIFVAAGDLVDSEKPLIELREKE
ncbi:MAG: acetyl-CoA carboxylase biotin carboxyl carrier protein subunit [Candidatus Aminicenantes bacterium]